MLSPDTDDADDTRMLAYARGLRNAQANTDEKENLTPSKEIHQ